MVPAESVGAERRPDDPPAERPATEPARAAGRPTAPRSRGERARTAALVVIATIATAAALRVGRVVLLPIVLALLLELVLAPVVALFARARVPRIAGSALLLVALVGTAGFGLWSLAEPAAEWARDLPRAVSEAQWKLADLRSSLEEVTRATKSLEELVSEGQPEGAGGGGAVVVRQEGGFREVVFAGVRATAVTTFLALALLFFLLAGEEAWLRKVARLAPGQDERVVVDAFRTVQHRISRYLGTITLINAGLGTAVGTVLWLLGLPNPVLWGVMAAFLNYVPYLGAAVGITVVALVSFVTFDSLGRALVPPLSYFGLNALEGLIFTPSVLGVWLRLSPVSIFVWLLLWGWIWGIPGALLAVPILVAVKLVCDHVAGLRTFGEILSR